MNADDLSRIAMSAGLGDTLARASQYARAQGHPEVALEHMLLALCEDPDAVLVLAASNVDVVRVKSDTLGYLTRLERRAPVAQSGEPAVSADLRRILEAAAAAARGGRRREINGAIVLAAIVGDGRSPAAHLLQAQGLTFDGAIRALQHGAGAASRAQSSANTEDILASARERVQSRARSRLPEEEEKPQAPQAVDYDDVPPTGAPRSETQPPAIAAEPEPPEIMAALGSTIEPSPALPSLDLPAFADARPTFTPPPLPPPIPVSEGPQSWAPAPAAPAPGAPARAAPPPLPPFHLGSEAPQRIGGEAPRPTFSLKRKLEIEELRRPPGVGAASDEGAFNAALARARFGSPGAMPPPQPVGRPVPPPRAEIGQLVENIPRTMRVAVPALVEVRIARAEVKALAEGLQGGGAAYRHEVTVTKAMAVRLRAPDGGFFIETASPETQWIEKSMLLSSEDYASWRWHVTPRDRGRKRLQLIISARTVSADGLAAETALPDQVITVRVRTNYARTASHWFGWGVAALVGGLIARFGETALDKGMQIVAKLTAAGG